MIFSKAVFSAFVLVIVVACTPIMQAHAQAPLPCSSYFGVPVQYIPNGNLNNVGIATHDNFGRPIIVMNPNVLNQFPPLAKEFWFAHECGHHALHPANNNEINADCFAMRSLRSLGRFASYQELEQMLFSISQLPGNWSSGHLPGPQRAQHLWNCLNS